MRLLVGAAVVSLTALTVALAVSPTIRRRLRQALCIHDPHLKFIAGHIWQECQKCGYERPGWHIPVRPEYPVGQPSKAKTTRRAGPTVKSFRRP